MSRLIVLSNRVMMPDNGPMAGGLAVALHSVLEGDAVIWMGWNGKIDDSGYNDNSSDNLYINRFSSSAQQVVADLHNSNTRLTRITTALTTAQYKQFYCGFANNVLWPLLHERVDLISQSAEDYAGYQEVNQLYARQLKRIIQADDVIWVHDYHFLSVAYHCRKLGISNRIGFFLHIPFAPLSFWQTLKQSRQLVDHLANYDVFGTQTQQDKANCLTVIQYYLKDRLAKGSELENLSIALDADNSDHNFSNSNRQASLLLKINLDFKAAHCLTVNAYPIGVDVAKIQQQVSHLPSLSSARSAQTYCTVKPYGQRIIAVDRIDYSKGLLERISAYHHFLQHNPQYQSQLELLQIGCPSRLDLPIYQQLYSKVTQAVDRVNQQFLANSDHYEYVDKCRTNSLKFDEFETNSCTPHWQAITYSESVLNHESLMIAFWHSDVGWVNSLKDGMNLVAKEYLAAQNPDNPGVLLLSRYAGAAEQMMAAVIIDPQQPISIINGLKTALTMPLAERKNRYKTLLQDLEEYDIQAWQQSFLNDLYASKVDRSKVSL